MSTDLIMGIDCSTTGCKTVVWDKDGYSVGLGRGEIPLLRPREGWHEQKTEHWTAALLQSIQDALKTVNKNRLAGLCICPQRETFVPVDEKYQPLRNAILWMDNRARGLLPALIEMIGSDAYTNLTGKPISGNLTVLKLAWLKKYEHEIYRRASKFLDVASFLNHFLTGTCATGWGIADPTGLFDMESQTWAEEILQHLQLRPDQLPATYPAGSLVGKITPEAAFQTGLPAGLPVFTGVGDGQAGGLALGILRPGGCYLSLGTSVVSGTYTQEYLTSRHFRTMFAGNQAGYSLETVILGGTYTIDWFLETMGQAHSLQSLEDELGTIPPGAVGLMLVPYWNSALNPYWDPQASGITLGWTGDHGPVHLYRAILEGIAYELRLHFDGVEAELGSTIERVAVMGGGSKSDRWCQIVADVTGKTLQRSWVTEATALGAGILAATGAGIYPNVESAAQGMGSKTGEEFNPNPEASGMYQQLYEQVYCKIFPVLQPLVRTLSTILHPESG